MDHDNVEITAPQPDAKPALPLDKQMVALLRSRTAQMAFAGSIGVGLLAAVILHDSGNATELAKKSAPLSLSGVAPTQEEGLIKPAESPVDILRLKGPTLSGGSQEDMRRLITDQIVVQFELSSTLFKSMATEEGIAKVEKRLSTATSYSLKYVSTIGDSHVFKVAKLAFGEPGDASVNLSERERLLAGASSELRKVNGVQGVEEDRIVLPAMVPNDANYAQQWHLKTGVTGFGINAERAWDKTIGNPNVVIAVLDTGVTTHADLTPNLVAGYDFVSSAERGNDGDGRDDDPSDPGDWVTADESYSPGSPWYGCRATDSSWHGTHVAGLAAAAGNNGRGVTGVSWSAKIQPVRVLGKCGGYLSDLASAIAWSAGVPVYGAPENKTPAKIISMSLGGMGSCSSYLQNAINLARQRGAVVVAAAGNLNMDAASVAPANCSGVIAVGATGKNGFKSYYSNYGMRVSIAAPGGDMSVDGMEGGILSTYNSGATTPGGETYTHLQGTSMATPLVSGAIALTMAANPKITAGDAAQAITRKAASFPTGSDCRPGVCGTGLLDVAAAVGEAVTMAADLTLDRLVLSQGLFIPGVPFDAKVNVINSGTLGTSKTTSSIKAFLSSSPDSTEGAVLLAETLLTDLDLDPKEVISGWLRNLILPKTTANGSYFLALAVNPNGEITESSTANNIVFSSAVQVETPELNISMKQVTDQAPTNVSLVLTPTNPKLVPIMMRAGWSYDWTFPEGVKVLKANKLGAFIQLANPLAEAPVTVHVRNDLGGIDQAVTSKLTAVEATPYQVGINRKAMSNQYMRAPLSISLSPTIAGGHPLDRPAGIQWKVNGGEQQSARGIPVFVLGPGQHEVEVTLTSKFGKQATSTETINVAPNLPPSCDIGVSHAPAKRTYTFIANCTDPDGYIKGYEWSINGMRVAGGRVYSRAYASTGVWDVTLIAIDDAGAVTDAATQVGF